MKKTVINSYLDEINQLKAMWWNRHAGGIRMVYAIC